MAPAGQSWTRDPALLLLERTGEVVRDLIAERLLTSPLEFPERIRRSDDRGVRSAIEDLLGLN